MHHHATHAVCTLKNMATYITGMDADDIPGLRIILHFDFVFLWNFVTEYDIMKFVCHKCHDLIITLFLMNLFSDEDTLNDAIYMIDISILAYTTIPTFHKCSAGQECVPFSVDSSSDGR
jgi:hypothetical protein